MINPWSDISAPSNDVNARRVDHLHPLDLYWARDHLGRYLFVYEFDGTSGETNKIPKLSGIQAVVVDSTPQSDKKRLVLVLSERADWEIFLSLCTDLIHATRHVAPQESAVKTILRRLSRWQDFLKKARKGLLTEDEIKGLIGELLFMKNYLIPVFGASQTIQFWQGPEGHPQDFNVINTAIEVKCQSGTTKPVIRITSVDQLCSQMPEMYLCVFTLGSSSQENEDSVNLPSLIEFLREKLHEESSSQIERFNNLLFSTGYIESDEYLEFNYLLLNDVMFEVCEGFPRITPADLHPGIVHLTYSINLDTCQPYCKEPDWLRGNL